MTQMTRPANGLPPAAARVLSPVPLPPPTPLAVAAARERRTPAPAPAADGGVQADGNSARKRASCLAAFARMYPRMPSPAHMDADAAAAAAIAAWGEGMEAAAAAMVVEVVVVVVVEAVAGTESGEAASRNAEHEGGDGPEERSTVDDGANTSAAGSRGATMRSESAAAVDSRCGTCPGAATVNDGDSGGEDVRGRLRLAPLWTALEVGRGSAGRSAKGSSRGADAIGGWMHKGRPRGGDRKGGRQEENERRGKRAKRCDRC